MATPPPTPRAGDVRPGARHAPLHQVLVSRRAGGATQVALAIARAALRRGWPGLTWVPGPGPARDAVQRAQLPHRAIPVEATSTSDLRRLLACGQLLAALVGRTPAVVHVHSAWMFGLIRPALVATGARTVVHFHIDPEDGEIAWTLKRPPHQVVACARYIADRVQGEVDRLGLRTRVTAVQNAVDLERFVPGDRAAARQELGLGAPGRFVALTLANLAPHKGQTIAIRAIHALARRGVDAELWLAGEDRSGTGTYEQELRRLADELQVTERVRFLGFRSDIARLLHASDVFLLPSAREGLPLSVLEAQASAIPVVTSAIPGMLEIIQDGVNGFAVAGDDPAVYAERLQTLHRDAGVRSAMTDAAIRRVRQEHAWHVFEDRMFGVYEEVASRPS